MNPPAPIPDEITTLIEKIPPHLPVRRIAEGLQNGTYDPLLGVDALFTALSASSGRPWRERVVAAWALGRVPLSPQERAAATDMLLDSLERDRNYSFASSFQKGISWGYGACVLLGFLIALMHKLESYYPRNGFKDWFMYSMAAAFFASPAILLLSGGIAWERSRKRNTLRATAAESLGRLAAPESLGALAGALFDRNAPVREAASTALHNILPTISDEHYGILGMESMTLLGRALTHGDTLLVLKLLKALAKIGSSHALPYVEQAARSSRMTKVRDEAHETLERMQERLLREKDAQTLMRASYPSLAEPSELLRPAHGVSPDDPYQLLRAAESE